MAEPPQKIAVIEKALKILENMVDYPYGVTLGELSKNVHLNKSTVYRILNTFKENGYIYQNPSTNEYKLDYKLMIFSSAFDNTDIKQIAFPYMQELTAKTSLSINLAILDHYNSMTIDRTSTPKHSPIRVEATIGYSAPLYTCASGKVLLSGMTNEEVEFFISQVQLTAFTPHTITNPLALRREIMQVRNSGFAIEDEEKEDNIVTISVPLKNASCKIVAAIAIMSVKQVMTQDTIPQLTEQLTDCARQISKELGCHNY